MEGVTRKFRNVLKKEDLTISDFASQIGVPKQTIYNKLSREGRGNDQDKTMSMKYGTVEEWLDELGYEIVFRNKATQEIID